jgi:hypothetical protein
VKSSEIGVQKWVGVLPKYPRVVKSKEKGANSSLFLVLNSANAVKDKVI